MPTASDKLRNFAQQTFGGLDIPPVQKELEMRGFTLTKDWCWQRSRQPSNFEWDCIYFLIQEWDYGGYIEN